MDIPNFIKKVNSWSLKMVKEDLHTLSDVENVYLYNIFKCKEDIARCLADLLSADKCEWERTEKQQESRHNLIENLNMKSDSLLKKFMINYCLGSFSVWELMKYDEERIKKFTDESLEAHYKDVNFALSRLVFHRVWHGDILEFMKNVKHINTALNSLIYDYINDDLLPNVSKALDLHIEKFNSEWNELKKALVIEFWRDHMDQVTQFLNKTIFDIKNDALKIIWNWINKKIYDWLWNDIAVPYWDFVVLVAVASIDAVDLDYFTDLFWDLIIKYLKENTKTDDVEKKDEELNNSIDNKFEFDDFDKLSVLSRNICKDMWYQWELNDLDPEVISENAYRGMDFWRRELLSIIDKEETLYIVNKISVSDDEAENNAYMNKLYAKYPTQFYELFVKWLIRRSKAYFRKNLSSVDLSKQEREDLKKNMDCLYPDATKKTWLYILSSTKWKALKQEFVDENIDDIVSNFSDVLAKYKSEIETCSWVDVTILFWILLTVISDIDLDMKGKLIDFSNTRLKQLYEEDKEKRELKQKQQEMLDKEVEGEVEKVVEEEKIEDDVVEKNLLPDGMSDDLVAYFWHDIDQRLDRYLRNSWWMYKSDWFSKYNVDKQFFEILDKYNFICIDEEDIVDEVIDEWVDDVVDISKKWKIKESPEIIELKNILKEIEIIDSVEQKVDLFVRAFKLFYDVYDEQNFKNSMFEYCRDNREVLNGVWSTLDMLSKWKKEKVETSKSREWKYYKFNIWGTWYRLVLQNQKWSSKRIIIDFADHDTYEWRCDYYYNFTI